MYYIPHVPSSARARAGVGAAVCARANRVSDSRRDRHSASRNGPYSWLASARSIWERATERERHTSRRFWGKPNKALSVSLSLSLLYTCAYVLGDKPAEETRAKHLFEGGIREE